MLTKVCSEVLLVIFLSILPIALGGQGLAQDVPGPLSGYATFDQTEAKLKLLDQSPWATLTSIGRTKEGRNVWLLTVTAEANQVGGANPKPGIAILGNVSASHVVGRELATRMAERIVLAAETDAKVVEVLSNYTLYFIPSPTPDATEKNFRVPVREHNGNTTPTDDDRDHELGEDPPVDLNQDGWITVMRVADSLGDHRVHPKNPQVLIPIDKSKHEVGEYRVLTEAMDADGDESFGEDGSDGVDFNRNFDFNYKFFGKGAGPHQVSEGESRAVADFLFDHPNIAFMFCFSPEDNLFHTWKGNSQADSARIRTSVLSSDQRILDCLADSYQKIHGGKSAPKSPKGEGSFSEWSYFHYGRWTLAARGWWIPTVEKKEEKPSGEGEEHQKEQPATDEQTAEDAQPDPPKSSQSENASKSDTCCQTNSDKLDKDDQRGADDLNALQWFEEQSIAGFIPWQPYDHPDFPGKRVEIGGFKPLVLLNPPEALIEPLVQPHVNFILELARVWPQIEIRDAKAVRLGPGLYDIQCKLVNVGPLPTMPEIGSVNRQWYPIQIQLQGVENARWVEGSPRQSVGRLVERGGSKDLRWVFFAGGASDEQADNTNSPTQFTIKAWAPTLQPIQHTVEVTQP